MAMTFPILAGPKSQPGSLRSWLNYQLLDAEGCLLDAQAWIVNAGGMRCREMRASAQPTMTSGVESTVLPSGFLDPISLVYRDGNGELENRDESWINENRIYDASGVLSSERPCAYGIFNEAFQWDAKP